LVTFQKVLGVVYLDTTEPRARFEEHHLQLLSTVGAIAAASMEAARRIEHLTHGNERLASRCAYSTT
jgi:GAF domain-containing protein